MSRKEVQRLQVINRVIGGEIDQRQTAQLLALAVR
jgi:hypothetical protein